jgi:sn-glycerol 3-phosphate transport system permease protein
VAGLVGPLLFYVPLRFCTFGPRPRVDLLFGLALGATGTLLAVRIAWTLLDPAGAKLRAVKRDTTTHGVFRGHPFLPWVLLAPTLIILILFLYWPALVHPRAVHPARAARGAVLGRPLRRELHRADRPASPVVTFAVLLVTLVLFVAGAWLDRRGDSRSERWGSWLTTLGVGATLVFLYLLWTASYQRVFVVTLIISAGTVVIGLAISIVIAYLAYQPMRGGAVYRTLLIWPYAISPRSPASCSS